MKEDFQVSANNAAAQFSLTLHRGEGMLLLAMNWKQGKPPDNFVGFAIEYREPKGVQFYPLQNRLGFPGSDKSKDPNIYSTLNSPIQKFRWVHFPRNANLEGLFSYRVTPAFMDDQMHLSYGIPQTADIALARETYPGKLNVAFTRGYVASQAFVDYYEKDGPISKLVAPNAAKGLDFKPTHPDAKTALPWMGFEAYQAILDLLDEAIADKTAQVRVIAYDFNEPEIVDRIKKLNKRVKVIIDDSSGHGGNGTAETEAEGQLDHAIGKDNVMREHMGHLQHNKTIAVNGTKIKKVVCGSTNLSWRGFFVQNNNAVVLTGAKPVKIFIDAFDNFWNHKNKVNDFGATSSAKWNELGLSGINAKVAFSPHVASNALLKSVGDDIEKANSSVLYSLAFLYESPGAVHDAIKKVTNSTKLFVYGISDKKAGGILVQKPDGSNPAPVYPSQLNSKKLPAPFKPEVTGGRGARMHHKFVVIDFNKPTARVYLGSYNFSNPADLKNGENLLLIKDRRIATSYMIEALRIFDHYEFRVTQLTAKKARKTLELQLPPKKSTEKPWWSEDWTDKRKINDRILFS
ncbi:MAG TPA: phospholipase D-like domain-containing protein [Puia sp.]|nr:phospholipase D-like domain-containing protein [Puia sp.]